MKKNLDALRDGDQDTEVVLIRASGRSRQKGETLLVGAGVPKKQLEVIEFNDPSYVASVDAIRSQLKAERPWLDIGEIDSDVAAVKEAYRSKRSELLGWQEETD